MVSFMPLILRGGEHGMTKIKEFKF